MFRGDYYGTVVAIKRLNAANNLQQEHLNKYIQREVALLKCAPPATSSPSVFFFFFFFAKLSQPSPLIRL